MFYNFNKVTEKFRNDLKIILCTARLPEFIHLIQALKVNKLKKS